MELKQNICDEIRAVDVTGDVANRGELFDPIVRMYSLGNCFVQLL